MLTSLLPSILSGQWEFNLRRANLHLLPLIETRGGVILVDSTRRGKVRRLPSSLLLLPVLSKLTLRFSGICLNDIEIS
jgi:hypothetical protein